MAAQSFAQCRHRGVIAITGPDAETWLDNLVTNDLGALAEPGAVFAALLSPQGKILFEFFVVRADDGLHLDVLAASIPALVKRLSLYKLRAKITIADVSAQWCSVWRRRVVPDTSQQMLTGGIAYADPRAPGVLWRGLLPITPDAALPPVADDAVLRVAYIIPEAPEDYALGDVFPHEANYDLRNGVSFTKGCFIGQEVVSRMQNKAVVRKRVVQVTGPAGAVLGSGTDITVGAATVGKLGTVSGHSGLAMLRLDRVVEALAAGQAVLAGGVPVSVELAALDRYRLSAANRPVHDL